MVISDTTALSYWLNWRVLVCGIWVSASMIIAAFIIWKYENWNHAKCKLKHDRRGAQEQLPQLSYDDGAWRTCLKQIHPIWLLAFRVISFALFLAILIIDVVGHGAAILFYYTQWTFTLVTIYFGLGTALSIYGCCQRHKIRMQFHVSRVGIDSVEESNLPLSHGEETCIVVRTEDFCRSGAGVWGFIFQVIFQVIAGAVVLTDCIYWSVIFPFLTLKYYDLNYMTFIMHSLNAVFLLGDTTLNCLRFPWFRIAYFVVWTGIFVISQWIIHACTSIWWPYPFLDLSLSRAPLWYALVGLLHIPCYSIFGLIVEMKVYLLSKWLPESCQCFR